MLKKLHRDQGGNVFVEVALVIILLVLAVAPYLSGLGSATGNKMSEMADKVGEVGTP